MTFRSTTKPTVLPVQISVRIWDIKRAKMFEVKSDTVKRGVLINIRQANILLTDF